MPHTSAPAADPAPTLVDLVVATLEDHKAEDIAVIDLRGRTSIADHMVIATGKSSRQVAALSDFVARALKTAGQHVQTEGEPQCDWVLVDAGDVIVHLFRPEVRAFYNLEKMWGTMEAKAEYSTASAIRAKAMQGA